MKKIDMHSKEFVARILNGERDFSNIVLKANCSFAYTDEFIMMNNYFEDNERSLARNPLDFSNSNFNGLNLPNIYLPFLTGKLIDFSNSNLEGANFRKANIPGANFSESYLSRSNFLGARIPMGNFLNLREAFDSHFVRCDLAGILTDERSYSLMRPRNCDNRGVRILADIDPFFIIPDLTHRHENYFQ